MRILVSGPPSAGKTRQGRILSEELGLPHVSSGQLIRDAAAEGDPVATKLLAIVADGSLSPSEEITALVLRRLEAPDCRDGFILDGFPRRWMEAEALAERHRIDACFVLEAHTDVLLERLRMRLAEGRTDDDPIAFPRRIHTYETETRIAQGALELMHVPIHRVDAAGSWRDISSQILARLPCRFAAPRAA